MGKVSYASAEPAARVHARLDLHSAPPFALSSLAVLGLGSARGGYFPTSWGWAIVAAVVVIVWALALAPTVRPHRAESVFVAGLLALACWYALSSTWGSLSAIDESVRALVYVVGALAALVVVRRGSSRALLGGVLAGATAVAAYALATRLFPDRIGTFDSVAVYRLSTPIGYWNALGLLCAVAILLGVGLTAAAASPGRAAWAAAPVPVLLATLYFTFSRGSWLALAAGFAVALALDPRRLRLTAVSIAVGVPAALAVLAGSNSSALTHQRASLARAAHDGHRLAILMVVLVAAAAGGAALLTAFRARLSVSGRVSQIYAVVLVLGGAATVSALLVHFGGPSAAAHRAWRAFSAPPATSRVDLRERLFTLSSNGRIDLWRASLHQAGGNVIAGAGGGSYERYWLAHRPNALKVRDAHSLYLETFAELGLVGLILLVGAFGAPLAAGLRARRHPGVAIATGAYTAFLVGAGVDWDWEITSVTLAVVFVGVAVLASARGEEEREASKRLRVAVLAGALAIGAVGFVFLVGNMFLSRAESAAHQGRWAAAARDATRASSWLPWSSAPSRQLGEAELGQGRTTAARLGFQRAIAKDAGDWTLWLGLARASTGRVQRQALAHASRLNPRSPEIRQFRAELGGGQGISITAGGG